MTEEQVKECLHDYLIPAITRFHICRKDLSDRDDVSESFNVELSDTEIEILSNFLLLEYIDSTGIGAIMTVYNEVKKKNKVLTVKNANRNIAKLFKITELDKIFNMEK